MADYVFGANILENLTTGMYKTSQIIFREYVQNSCDAIDKAIAMGILSSNAGKIHDFDNKLYKARNIIEWFFSAYKNFQTHCDAL